MSSIELLYNLAIVLLVIHPDEKKICTQIFIAALFTVVKKQKQTKLLIHWWMDKLKNVVYPYDGIFTNNKEGSIDTCYNIGETWEDYTRWKKWDVEGHTLYESVYLKCPE